MSDDWHVPLPSEEESRLMAADYLEIAMRAAAGEIDNAADLVQKFMADADPQVVSFRLWAFSAVGPVLAAAAIQQIMPREQGEQWIVLQDRRPSKDEPAALAAFQAVCCQLNDDHAGSHDVMTAHYDAARKAFGFVGAHEAMLSMALFQLQVLAYAIRQGAFGGAS